jgi:hypothetical protein
MISTADVQTDIITKLKAHAALTTLVDDEIREENWMGTAYTYPSVRVHITRLQPIERPGSCEDTAFMCQFNVGYRVASPSSKNAADGLQVAIEALLDQHLSGAGIFTARTGVTLQDVGGPIPEAENAWVARAFFNCRLQEL